MPYSTVYDAATDPASPLRKQVAVAIHVAATDVLNEPPGSQFRDQRFAWARRVISSDQAPLEAAKRWIWRVLQNPTIAAAPGLAPDADVQFVINLMVDTMARAG